MKESLKVSACLLSPVSNASPDLSLEEFAQIAKLIARRFNTSSHIISVGGLSRSTCMFHNTIRRSYAIGKTWYDDFCYPCFSRDVASKDFGTLAQRGSGKDYAGRRGKPHWVQG